MEPLGFTMKVWVGFMFTLILLATGYGVLAKTHGSGLRPKHIPIFSNTVPHGFIWMKVGLLLGFMTILLTFGWSCDKLSKKGLFLCFFPSSRPEYS